MKSSEEESRTALLGKDSATIQPPRVLREIKLRHRRLNTGVLRRREEEGRMELPRGPVELCRGIISCIITLRFRPLSDYENSMNERADGMERSCKEGNSMKNVNQE